MEITNYHELEELGKGQKQSGDASTYVLPNSQNPSPLSSLCTTRKDPESEQLAWDNLETYPITMKAETVSHVAEQSSWVPYPSDLHLGAPSQ